MMLRIALAVCLLALPGRAAGQAPSPDQPLPDSQQDLPPTPRQVPGEDLQREISGNTITGVHASGMPYSEFHSPDGRIYGHNNHVPVRDGCWVVRQDEVCYTYEQGPAPGVFCWRFYRAQGGYTIFLPQTGTVGTAKLTQGNPNKFNDGGKPWSCDALLSMR